MSLAYTMPKMNQDLGAQGVEAASPDSPVLSCLSCPTDCSSSSPSCLSTRTSIKVEVTTETHRWSCTICPRRFVHQSSLRRHTATHSGLRKYRCETCDKTFQQSSTLKSHMRTHSGVKPFACRVCDMSFSQSGYRNQHEINVHRVVPASPAIRPPPSPKLSIKALPHIKFEPQSDMPSVPEMMIAPQMKQLDDDMFDFPSLEISWDMLIRDPPSASPDHFFESIWAI